MQPAPHPTPRVGGKEADLSSGSLIQVNKTRTDLEMLPWQRLAIIATKPNFVSK
jgi:hypothetical protein